MSNLGLQFCTVLGEALNDPSGLQKVVVQLIGFLVYGKVLSLLGHANSAWQIGCENSRTAARIAIRLRSAAPSWLNRPTSSPPTPSLALSFGLLHA
jgi:hypothetical protein